MDSRLENALLESQQEAGESVPLQKERGKFLFQCRDAEVQCSIEDPPESLRGNPFDLGIDRHDSPDIQVILKIELNFGMDHFANRTKGLYRSGCNDLGSGFEFRFEAFENPEPFERDPLFFLVKSLHLKKLGEPAPKGA